MAADDISLGVALDAADFLTKMDSMNRRLDDFATHTAKAEKAGGLLQNAFSFATGGAILQGINAIAGAASGLLSGMVGEATDGADGLAQLDAALTSTGGKAGVTRDQVLGLVNSLSAGNGLSKATDDAVLAADNMLLTFTNIGSGVFNQATQEVLDMSQALGTDATQSAVMLGKALNSPIEGISALQRVGVTFTASQKAVIDQLMATGDVAGAQRVILQELSNEFGGSAAAAADTFSGHLLTLQEQFANAEQTVGDRLLPILDTLVQALESPQAQAAVSAIADGLANGLAAALPVVGELAGAALQFVGVAGQMLGAVMPFVSFLAQNAVPVVTGLAIAALPSLGASLVATLPLWAASTAAATTAAAAWLAALGPIGLLAAAVIALGVAWNSNFLGMRSTFEPWVKSVDDGLAEVQAKLGHDLRAALGQSTADYDAAMATNERRTKIMRADINDTLEGARNDWDQSGAMIAASTAARGQENVAATAGVWTAIHQTVANAAQAVVATASQAGALQAQGYLDNMIKQYGTGQPAIDAYLTFLIKRHDLKNALAVMGHNNAIAFLNALVIPVANSLEKMANSFASMQVFKGTAAQGQLDQLVAGFRKAGEFVVGTWGSVTNQFQGFSSSFQAEIPKITVAIAKVSGAGGSVAAATGKALSEAAKAQAGQAQALTDQTKAIEDATKAHDAALQKAAEAVKQSYDEQGKAMSAGAVAGLEAQQAQRDIEQGMVTDAEKNYQAYADAVKHGYEQAGDAMSAAVTRQLEDQQRMRDAAAAQVQAAQQLAQSLAGVATAMQDHSKTALDIMQQLGPLAQQAAAAGAGGLADTINAYMQQAASGANVNMQDVYQAITGWLQQATQSGDAMLAVFARNALQHLAIAQQIQAATDSLIPFQSAVDGARASLEQANAAVQDAQDAVGRYRNELQSAQDDLRHFTQTPLEGEHAFSEQLFANQQAQAALQLRINQMMAGGAHADNPQLKALQTQLENVRRAGENIRLQEQLTIGQQRHDLGNQAAGPPQEISATAAAAGIDAAKARIDSANNALTVAQDRLTSLQRVQAGAQAAVAAATAAFNAQQASVQALTAQLQQGTPAVAQFGTALGTGLGSMAPAAQTALGDVNTAFGAVFGTGQGGPGGQGGQLGSIMSLLFAHDENAFFAKLDAQTNERMDGYTAGTWAAKLQNLDDRISDGLGTIKATATDLATGVGTAIADGMAQGITSAAEAVASAAVAIVQGAIAAANAAAQVHSPSKVFAGIGANMGAGMAVGLAGQGAAVAGASAGLVGAAAGAAQGAIGATVPVGATTGAGGPVMNFTAYLVDPFGGQRQVQVLREEMAYAQYSATRST